MPNWKKVIVSGSDATLNSLLVSSNIAIGTSSLGSSENTLVIGPAPAGGTGEGGQLLLQAPNSGGFTSASMLDNWQNSTRLLRGSNQSSDAVVTQWNMHTKQVSFPAYNSVSAFPGTAVANLAVDSGGNILTVSTSGGSVFPYTGVAAINGGLVVTGSITASSAIYAQANGAMYFRGGDDAELWDINVANTIGVYGQQDQTVGSIKLGSGGGTISGRSGSIGIGTITPTSASLTVNGNVWATSFTGSILGTATTASYILQAVSASFATSASQAVTAAFASNADLLDGVHLSTLATTGSNTFVGNQTITGSLNITGSITSTGTLTVQTIVAQTITSSTDFVTGSTRFGSLIGNTHVFTGSVSITGSLTTVGPIFASSFTGSYTGSLTGALTGTSSWATSASNAVSSAFATNAAWLDGLDSSVFALTGSNTFRGDQLISGSLRVTGSTSLTGSLGLLGAISASSFTGSYTGSLTGALTGTSSWATSASNAITAAFASNANLFDGLNSTIFATTGSNTFVGNQTITGSLTLSGSATTELIVRGDQDITGSLRITGSITSSRNIQVAGLTIGTGNDSTTSNTAFGLETLVRSAGSLNRNTAIGWYTLSGSTTGYSNTAIGAVALRNLINGSSNTGVGDSTLFSIVGGFSNSALGSNALGAIVEGYGNVGIGEYAGSTLSDQVTENTGSINSVYIGRFTYSSQSNSSNEIVIGYNTSGHGSNTVTLGNESIIRTILRGAVSASGGITGSLLGTASFATSASWAPGGGGGTPGGSDTQIQYNNGGAFDGSPRFIFDNVNNDVIVTGSVIVSGSSGTTTNTITYVGTTNSTGSSINLSNIAGLAIGDIVFIGSSNDNASNIIQPTGYTASFSNIAGTSPSYVLSYKFITSSADIASITVTNANNSGSHLAAAFRNVAGINVSASATNTTGLPDPPSITTTVNGAMIVAWGFEDDITGSISNITASSGYTLIGAISSGSAGINFTATTMAEYLLQSTSGAINPGVFTSNLAFTDNWVAATLALTPTTSSFSEGTITAGSFTGSLLGTASFATSASWAPGTSQWVTNGSNIYYNIGRVGIGTTAPTVALDINAGSIKAGSNTATEGTVILQDYYTAGNLTNFGTNRSSGGPVISYASVPSTASAYNFTSTFSSPAGRSAIILEDRISFYTTASQTVASGSAIGIAERVRIADTGQLSFFRYTATSSFPGTVAAVLAVDSSGNVITTAASGSAGGGGGGTPGGANTTIQFNDSNTFSGSGNFTFNKTTNVVEINRIRIGRPTLTGGPNLNIFIGSGSLINATTGSENIAIGDFALANTTNTEDNIAIGVGALSSSNSSYNTAVGNYAAALSTTPVAGRNNAFGYASLYLNRTGQVNTAIGSYALYRNQNNYNAAFGDYALLDLTAGSENTAVGQGAGYTLQSGSNNLFIGRIAAIGLTTGSSNTIISHTVEGFSLGIITGSFNTIIGAGITNLSTTLNNNIILSDGQGNIRYRWNGTANVFTGSFVVTGSSGDLLRVVDSGSNFPTLAVFSSGSKNVLTVTTSSVIVTGSVHIEQGSLVLDSIADPAATATDTVAVYAKTIGGRVLPKWIGPSGVDVPFQPNIAFNNISYILPGGGNTITQFGCTVTTAGVVSNPALSSTNLKTQTRRIAITSATTAGSSGSIRMSNLECWRGNAAGLGGFYVTARFGFSGSVQTGMRSFVGLMDTTGSLALINPITDTTLSKIGMAITASTGTNWFLINNAAGTTPTTASLGAGFPVDTTTMYELILHCRPSGSAVDYRITNMSSSLQVSGSLTTNLPTAATFLARYGWVTNNTAAAAVALEISKLTLETDY